MAICASCGRENPAGGDFCEGCGAYLRWEKTSLAPAVSTPPARPAEDVPVAAPEAPPRRATRRYAAQPAAPAAGAEAVVLTLRLPDQESGSAEAVTATAEPGGQATLVALVRNQSAIVDSYELSVKGLPAEWCTIAPSTVYLVPFGAADEGYEQEVQVLVRPPRSSQAKAGPWPFAVVATSKGQGVEVASTRATLVVGPYYELADGEIRPERESGRRKADFAVAVRNRGNAPIELALEAADSDRLCRYEFAQQRLTAEPGQRVGTEFTVRPRKSNLLGRPVERRFEVVAQVAGSELPPMRKQGVFRQKAWLPWWLPVAVPMVIVPLVALWLLIPHKTAVPDLRGQTADAAQKLLTTAGLTLKTQPRTVAKGLVGKIVDQDPAAGAKVKKGAEITGWIGVGSEAVQVPSVCDMPLAKADAALRKAGLQAVVSPAPPASTAAPTAAEGCQLPAAGETVKLGTPVTVILKAAPKPKPAATGPTGTTTTSPGGGGGGGGKVAGRVVPAVAGLSAAAAAAALVKQGLAYRVVPQISTDKAPGTVLGMQPKPPAHVPAGGTVSLLVSAGAPALVFDDGHNLFQLGSSPGDQPKTLKPSIDSDEQEPSMNEEGTLIAYRGLATGALVGRIYVLDTATQAASALTDPASDYHRPVFAPTPGSDLLALIRQPADGSNSDGDLCFVHANGSTAPQCIADTQWNVTRPAWSPDGKAILVVATGRADPTKVGVLEYVSRRAFSARTGDWKLKGLVVRGFVTSIAWSPDGTKLAYAAKAGAGFQLFLAPVQNGVIGQAAPVPQTPACEVSWRSDERLALSQYDCANAASGPVVLVDPAKPATQTPLAGSGANPAWQQVELGLGG